MVESSVRKIKSLMMLKGITNIDIALKTGVSRTWVSLVLNNRKHSKRIQQAIADSLGRPYEELWPNSKQRAA
jgi:transcriptional regulator with XRE-family HTH domain